jgi:hypothetical protein
LAAALALELPATRLSVALLAPEVEELQTFNFLLGANQILDISLVGTPRHKR